MDEGNRVPQQRSRPRPYDLRRKVLLKNFLREQMTHIPLPPPRLPDEEIADDEVSSTVGNEENIEQPPENIIQINQESSNSSVHPPESLSQPGTSTSEVESPDSSTSQEPDEEGQTDKNPKPTFSRLSSLLRNKFNRKRGITKAKLKVNSLDLEPPKVVDPRALKPVVKPKKSFLAMFKARRVMQNRKKLRSPTIAPSPAPKTSTISVQTDVSFTQDEFNNMEQSNRSLREENRLLSESLSSFMSDFDLKLSPLKIPYGTDSYITSAGSSQSHNMAQATPVVPKRLNYNNDIPPRNKIPRSKSMQDRFDRRFPNRRTRSMNYGLTKRFYDSSALQQPHPYRRNSNSETSAGFRHERPRPNSFSSFDSNPSRNSTLQSNSRMPPHRLPIVKHPNNMNSTRAMNANFNNRAMNANSNNRAIVRRSSMPERSSYQPSRPILRHKSTRVNGYNHSNGYRGEHNYNVINGNVPVRRRSSSNGDYGRPVPFQNLPPEAFY